MTAHKIQNKRSCRVLREESESVEVGGLGWGGVGVSWGGGGGVMGGMGEWEQGFVSGW